MSLCFLLCLHSLMHQHQNFSRAAVLYVLSATKGVTCGGKGGNCFWCSQQIMLISISVHYPLSHHTPRLDVTLTDRFGPYYLLFTIITCLYFEAGRGISFNLCAHSMLL